MGTTELEQKLADVERMCWVLRHREVLAWFERDARSKLSEAREFSPEAVRAQIRQVGVRAEAFGWHQILGEAVRLDGAVANVGELVGCLISALESELHPFREALDEAAQAWPFSQLQAPLRAFFEASAKRLGRTAVLSLSGLSLPLDRQLSPVLAEAAFTLLENALEHGLESDSSGEVSLRLEEVEGGFWLRVSDTGRGIDLAALVTRALAAEVIQAEHVECRSPHELLALSFVDPRGCRLAEGPGLARMKAAVDDFGGHLEVRSTPGHGTTFGVGFFGADGFVDQGRPILGAGQ